MKLRNISILLFGVLVVAVTLSLWGAFAQGVAASPSVGPTAYLPGGSPTAAPSIAVSERNVSTPTPSTTIVPSATVAAGPVSGKVVNYGTSSDTFKRGERATGFITVQNTGNTPINDITTSVTAKAKLPVVGMVDVGNKDYTFSNLNIQPGDTKRVEFTVDIPSEYQGVSTAGDFTLQVAVKSGNTDIGSFTKSVRVE